MKKRISIITIIVLLIALITAGTLYFALPRIHDIDAATVEYTGTSETVVGYGTIKEKKRSGYYINLPAKVKTVYVSQGEQVTAGQPLIEFDRQATELYLKMAAAGMIRYDMDSDQISVGTTSDALSADEIQTMLTELEKMPDILYANYDCIITSIGAAEGEFSTPYEPIVVMSDTSGYLAVISIEESALGEIAVGSPATITGASFSGAYPAEVTEIATRGTSVAVVGTAKSMFDVTLTIDGGTTDLKPNQSARCEIVISTNHNAIRIPYDAVFSKNGHDCVYVVENGYAVLKYITIQSSDENGILIADGLQPGDVIAADYTQVPSDGCQVFCRNISENQ